MVSLSKYFIVLYSHFFLWWCEMTYQKEDHLLPDCDNYRKLKGRIKTNKQTKRLESKIVDKEELQYTQTLSYMCCWLGSWMGVSVLSPMTGDVNFEYKILDPGFLPFL